MPWRYDARALRYRDGDTGRFLSQARARELVGQSLRASGNATDELARLVDAGMLAPADWRARMREEIKGEVIRQYLIGRGGRAQMTAADWGSVGGMIAEQYRHLDRKEGNFYSLVADGALGEREIARRSRMYINSGREGHERALRRRLSGSRYNEEHWVTTADESCSDCRDNEAVGWVEIGTLREVPGSGGTLCLTNCECYLAYRMAETGELFGEEGGE